MLLKKKLQDPPKVTIFWHFKAPHIPSKKNWRAPNFSSTPSSNLNYDWSLTRQAKNEVEQEVTYLGYLCLEAKILHWTDQMLHAMLTSQFTFGTSVSMNIDIKT